MNHFFSKVLFCCLVVYSSFAYAAENKVLNESQQSYSNNFAVVPSQVVLEHAGKIKEMKIINLQDSTLSIQSNIKTYEQLYVSAKLAESNNSVSGKNSIIVTPMVIQGILPNGTQIIRMMATNQLPDTEQVYRLFVKSLAPRNVEDTGTQFQVEYGVPVFILPLNINESYSIELVKKSNKTYINVNNTGNVHILVKSISVKNKLGKMITLCLPGRILAGKNSLQEVSVPKELDLKNLSVVVQKSDLFKYEVDNEMDQVATYVEK